MLESPVARQTRTGEVTVGNATLTCGPEPAWLFACPETGQYVAGYHGQTPAPLALTIPEGKVEIEAMGVGTVHWNNGLVTVETIALKGTPKVIGGRYQPTEKEPQ